MFLAEGRPARRRPQLLTASSDRTVRVWAVALPAVVPPVKPAWLAAEEAAAAEAASQANQASVGRFGGGGAPYHARRRSGAGGTVGAAAASALAAGLPPPSFVSPPRSGGGSIGAASGASTPRRAGAARHSSIGAAAAREAELLRAKADVEAEAQRAAERAAWEAGPTLTADGAVQCLRVIPTEYAVSHALFSPLIPGIIVAAAVEEVRRRGGRVSPVLPHSTSPPTPPSPGVGRPVC